MLSVSHISKTFHIDPVLVDVNFQSNTGERLALVGANGCGKTTLLRIITGQEKSDSGDVRLSSGLHVGYLPQGAEISLDKTLGMFLESLKGDPDELAGRLEHLAAALMISPGIDHLQKEYDAILSQIEILAQSAGRAPEILGALSLGDLPLDLPLKALSGGQKTRLSLAEVLITNPHLLLLDEPTNHLDLDMLAWLEDWLLAFKGGVLVVSHDRAFIDRIATGVLELDGRSHTLRAYSGNYHSYMEQKQLEDEKHWQEYSDQQSEIHRLRFAATVVRSQAHFHKGGKADPENTDRFSTGFFADRSKKVTQKAKNIEKRLERLLNEDKIDKPRPSWQMKIEFENGSDSSRQVVLMEDLTVGYKDYRLLSNLNLHIRLGERIALVGPNGCGKTTLLRTIAGVLPPLSGRLNIGSQIRLGFMAQEQEELDASLTPLSTLQKVYSQNQTDVRAYLSKYLFFGDDVFVQVGKLSYGERARLSLALLVARGCNFLLLDEPLNHLDIPARTRFEQALSDFEGTVLVVTHDRYFIQRFASEIWRVQNSSIIRDWNPREYQSE